MKTKPKKCCYPDCFNCPYVDCRWDCASPSQYAYIHSEAGKAAQERYNKSEKGKERDKRRQKRRIESGKNAEMCRKYYARNREKILDAKKCKRNEKLRILKEKRREYDRQRYLKRKEAKQSAERKEAV